MSSINFKLHCGNSIYYSMDMHGEHTSKDVLTGNKTDEFFNNKISSLNSCNTNTLHCDSPLSTFVWKCSATFNVDGPV